MTRRLYIDCQTLQTAAFDRGMGKYSLALLKCLLRQNGIAVNDGTVRFEPVLILSKNLPQPPRLKKALQTVAANARALTLDLPVQPVENTAQKYEQAEVIMTKAIAADIKNHPIANGSAKKSTAAASPQALFLLLTPFYVDAPAVFPDVPGVGKASIVYDIIPVIIWQRLRIFQDDLYFRHYALFGQADVLLSISGAVKEDLVTLVGVPREKVTVINGGPQMAPAGKVPTKSNTYGKYILCNSANIVHKNNTVAVQGFADFNKQVGNVYTLVFTSTFDASAQESLRKLHPHIAFSGNVSDEELVSLYQHTEAVLFPSLAEGLGMPVLEGAMNGKPVVCSDIPVLKEISAEAFYFFSPSSPAALARALKNAVEGTDWQEKKAHYPTVLQKYSWEVSARAAAKALNTVKLLRAVKAPLTVVCPDPRHDAPAARLVELLYFTLAEKHKVSLQFTSSKGQSVPAFTPYLPASSPENGAPTLFIGTKSKPPAQLKRKDVYIAVRPQKQGFLGRVLSGRNALSKVLYARKYAYNAPLGLQHWVYGASEGGVLQPQQIITEYGAQL